VTRHLGPVTCFSGTSVARIVVVMIRRITALLAMAAIVGLVILLMWDVYLHHSSAGVDDSRVSILALAA
jgi:hypothetical protein